MDPQSTFLDDGSVLVTLPESPGGGYRWELVDVPSGTRLLDTTWEPTEGEQTAGGAGKRAFWLRPGADKVALVFRLKRPWEAEALEEVRVDLDQEIG
jgi:predicted secreted protein